MAKKSSVKGTRVVLDASVYLAGIGSSEGASRLILEAVKAGAVETVISSLIVDEVLRNLDKFTVAQRGYFVSWIAAVQPKVSRLQEAEVAEQENKVESKDAHVVALAVKNKTDFLVTLDKRHLLKLRSLGFSFSIVDSGAFLHWLRRSRG